MQSGVSVRASIQRKPRLLRPKWLVAVVVVTGLGLLLWPSRSLRSENFVIYQPTSRAVLPLQIVDQTKYLPLLSVLNSVGKVGAIQERRNSLRVWFGESEIEVRADEKRVRLGKNQLTLAQPVRKPHSQWLVPLEFLTACLPQLTQREIQYKVGASRIFLGDVRPLTFTLRLDPAAQGARITVQFSGRVAVRTTATDGKWYIYLGDQPVQPLEETFRFQNPFVSEIVFDDQDGVPKLIVSPTTPNMDFYPSSAEGGRILLADVLKPPPAPAQEGEQPTVATAPALGVPELTIPEEPPPGVPGPPLPIVVLDAAHGGDDIGARGRDGVLEKDVTAQLAARVRMALLATRKYRIQLTRVGDVNPSFEQREIVANTLKPVAFLSLHAGDLGNTTPRVAVCSYRSAPLDPGESQRLLIPWREIQRMHLERSRLLAKTMQARFAQVPGLTADKLFEAPVRSLRSIDAPAVAIEIGTLTADQESGPLTNVAFQQQLATAIAAGLEAFRSGEGGL